MRLEKMRTLIRILCFMLLASPFGLERAGAENPALLKSDCSPREAPWHSTTVENLRLESSILHERVMTIATHGCSDMQSISELELGSVRGGESGDASFTPPEAAKEQDPSLGGADAAPESSISEVPPANGEKKRVRVEIKRNTASVRNEERNTRLSTFRDVALVPTFGPSFGTGSPTPNGFSSRLIQNTAPTR